MTPRRFLLNLSHTNSVGQVGNLRPIGNRPVNKFRINQGGLTIRRRLPTCPTRSVPIAAKRKHSCLCGFLSSFTLVLACFLVSATQLLSQQPRQPRNTANLLQTNPYSSAADIEAGRKIFGGRCGHCHGQAGEGGRGAVLNSGELHHSASDREMFLVIRNGIPNSEMPGTFGLPDMEVWRMVAYVKQLRRQGSTDQATGNATAGALVYRKNACSACHSIDGQGGFVGTY